MVLQSTSAWKYAVPVEMVAGAMAADKGERDHDFPNQFSLPITTKSRRYSVFRVDILLLEAKSSERKILL